MARRPRGTPGRRRGRPGRVHGAVERPRAGRGGPRRRDHHRQRPDGRGWRSGALERETGARAAASTGARDRRWWARAARWARWRRGSWPASGRGASCWSATPRVPSQPLRGARLAHRRGGAASRRRRRVRRPGRLRRGALGERSGAPGARACRLAAGHDRLRRGPAARRVRPLRARRDLTVMDGGLVRLPDPGARFGPGNLQGLPRGDRARVHGGDAAARAGGDRRGHGRRRRHSRWSRRTGCWPWPRATASAWTRCAGTAGGRRAGAGGGAMTRGRRRLRRALGCFLRAYRAPARRSWRSRAAGARRSRCAPPTARRRRPSPSLDGVPQPRRVDAADAGATLVVSSRRSARSARCSSCAAAPNEPYLFGELTVRGPEADFVRLDYIATELCPL